MTDFLLGFIIGALLTCAVQLSAINNNLDGIKEQLYGIKIRLNRRESEMPDDEEDATDDT